jgi:hypothetical protein
VNETGPPNFQSRNLIETSRPRARVNPWHLVCKEEDGTELESTPPPLQGCGEGWGGRELPQEVATDEVRKASWARAPNSPWEGEGREPERPDSLEETSGGWGAIGESVRGRIHTV